MDIHRSRLGLNIRMCIITDKLWCTPNGRFFNFMLWIWRHPFVWTALTKALPSGRERQVSIPMAMSCLSGLTKRFSRIMDQKDPKGRPLLTTNMMRSVWSAAISISCLFFREVWLPVSVLSPKSCRQEKLWILRQIVFLRWPTCTKGSIQTSLSPSKAPSSLV